MPKSKKSKHPATSKTLRFTYVGRPKKVGTKMAPVMVTLTPEQIEFLDHVPNRAALIRQLVSEHMEATDADLHEKGEEYVKVKAEFDEYWYGTMIKYLDHWGLDGKEPVFKPGTDPTLIQKYKELKEHLDLFK